MTELVKFMEVFVSKIDKYCFRSLYLAQMVFVS